MNSKEMEALLDLFDRHNRNGLVSLDYETEVY